MPLFETMQLLEDKVHASRLWKEIMLSVSSLKDKIKVRP